MANADSANEPYHVYRNEPTTAILIKNTTGSNGLQMHPVSDDFIEVVGTSENDDESEEEEKGQKDRNRVQNNNLVEVEDMSGVLSPMLHFQQQLLQDNGS